MDVLKLRMVTTLELINHGSASCGTFNLPFDLDGLATISRTGS